MLVVYRHSIDMQLRFGVSAQQHFFYLRHIGSVGVDIFFVISGFIICFVANEAAGFTQGVDFLAKRFLRINPIYYLATLLYLLPLALYLWKNGKLQTILSASLLKNFLILPFTDKSDLIYPILTVGWTLGFEWYFYLLFFILILVKVRNKFLTLFLLLSFLVLAGRWLPPLADHRLVFMTNPLLLEFLCGGLICWCYLHLRIGKRFALFMVCAAIGAWVYEIFGGFGNIFYIVNTNEDSLQRILYWGIPSALLVAGCVFLEKLPSQSYLWDHPFATLAGNASYSIYLTHPTVFVFFSTLYLHVGFFLNPDLAVLIQVAIALAVGILFYKLVEFPLLRLLKKAVRPQPY